MKLIICLKGVFLFVLRTTWFRPLRYPEAMRRERAFVGLGWLEFHLPFPYSRVLRQQFNVGYFAIGWDAREPGHAAPGTVCTLPPGCSSANWHRELPRLKNFTLYFCPAKRPYIRMHQGDAYRDESHQTDEEDLKYKMLSYAL